MSNDKDSEYQRSVQLAHEVGLAWLNDVFRFRDGTYRVLRTRISGLEVFWALVTALLFGLVGYALWMVLGDLWFFDLVLHPISLIIESLVVGWVLGRRVAHMSPLRRQTGEGSSVWIRILFSRLASRATSKYGRPKMYNRCYSVVNNQSIEVECIDWVGTSPAPRSPDTSLGSYDGYSIRIDLPPRGRPATYPSKR